MAKTKVAPSPTLSRRALSLARKESRAVDGDARPFAPTLSRLTLKWQEATEEDKYKDDHNGRMRRGFISSTLTRVSLFILVGTLYMTLFGSDKKAHLSAYISFSAVILDVLLTAIFYLTRTKRYLQTLCCISCSMEGVAAVLAGCLLKVDAGDDRLYLIRQWFLYGGQISCLKLSFGIPKISLLRFPYLVMVIIAITTAEVAMLLLGYGDPGFTLVLVFSFSYNFVAIINSRQFEGADRRLYCMIQNEKIRNESMKEQMKRTNKLGRTVLAMSDNDGRGSSAGSDRGSDEGESESASVDDGASDGTNKSDLVGEFAFWSRLKDKAEKDGEKLPSVGELKGGVPEMVNLEAAMKVARFKKGFRYFCNEENNLENLLFFEQVSMYRDTVSRRAQRLCHAFIAAGAPSEVNINSAQRECCINNVMGGNVTLNAFDDAQREIGNVMNRDVWPRFVKSEIGRALMHAQSDAAYGDFVATGLKEKKKGGDKEGELALGGASPVEIVGERSTVAQLFGMGKGSGKAKR